MTHPASVAEAIGCLRDRQITLTYDQDAGTLQAATSEAAKTIIGKQAEPGRSAAPAPEGS